MADQEREANEPQSAIQVSMSSLAQMVAGFVDGRLPGTEVKAEGDALYVTRGERRLMIRCHATNNFDFEVDPGKCADPGDRYSGSGIHEDLVEREIITFLFPERRNKSDSSA